MLFIARFEDDPEALHVRETQTENHMAFLAANADHIIAAGPLRDDPDAPPVGAVWIVEADDHATAMAILDQDPFWIHGLRAARSLLQWTRSVPDHPVTI
jgi:uncharacterized protein